jgi:hypothetical protein
MGREYLPQHVRTRLVDSVENGEGRRCSVRTRVRTGEVVVEPGEVFIRR